jgi:hypothetical protein
MTRQRAHQLATTHRGLLELDVESRLLHEYRLLLLVFRKLDHNNAFWVQDG